MTRLPYITILSHKARKLGDQGTGIRLSREGVDYKHMYLNSHVPKSKAFEYFLVVLFRLPRDTCNTGFCYSAL